MKKLLCAVCAVVAFALLSGCDSKAPDVRDAVTVTTQIKERQASLFIEVERGITWRVVYYEDTKVMYVVSGGVFTALLNPDGTPMLWEGEK